MTLPLKAVAAVNRRELRGSTPPDFAFRYVDISSVTTGSMAVPEDSVTFSAAPSRARRLAPVGAVVLSTVRTYLRAIARVEHPDLVFSTGFAVLEAKPKIDPRFLYFTCLSEHFVGAVEARSTGVSYPAIGPAVLMSIQVAVPKLEEQRRIADFLDDQVARLDAAVGAARQTQALLEQRALTGVHDAVTGRGHEDRMATPLPWAPDLPAHWQVAKLSLLARMGTGHTPSRSEPELWIETSIPWLTTNDVHRFRHDEVDVLSDPALSISQTGLANSAAVLHPAGTVALSRTASAGFSVIMGRDMATSQDFVTWTCGPRLLPHYLLAVLRASRQDLLGRLAMGSTHKTIYFPDLEALRVPLPPLPEQQRAVEAVQRVQQEARALRAEVGDLIALLEERKRALITACVTGEFDVSTASTRAGDAALQGFR